MKKLLAPIVFTLLASSLATPVLAGPFSVTPVRIYMTPKDKAIAVTINNEGDTELVMQADVYTWKQKANGEDDLVLTEDLLLSPPIIKIAGKSRQVVRLARLQPGATDQQQTYRMIVREIPEATQNNKNMQLQIAIAFSMPIFITPSQAKSKMDCVIERAATDTVRAVCESTGNAYAQVIDLEVTNAGNEKLASRTTGGYILPTNKRTFEMKSENNKAIPAGSVVLTTKMDDGSTQTFNATLSN